ncbi:MAG: alpha-1,4-glucan--maltose-1-phosphate maltosyltransferase [Alphaproteobacteria bacterium]|nr:alpha-1,4-glucan--maltose-1-phosphate maltosyltransferase [Alphaproteobacteria bacterium]
MARTNAQRPARRALRRPPAAADRALASLGARTVPTAADHPHWTPLNRIVIELVYPEIDGGRYPVKRIVGERFTVWADVFRDGHDVVAARVRHRAAEDGDWKVAPMAHHDNDRWTGEFRLDRMGRHFYTVDAWTDVFATWRRDAAKKLAAGQDTMLELLEGREILEATLSALRGSDAACVRDALARAAAGSAPDRQCAALLDDKLAGVMARVGPRADQSSYARELEVVADRRRAGFAAWYEMVPRSQGAVPGRSGTFDDCIRRLPGIRAMGFDVVYFTPIHPIGRVNRKGANNSLDGGPDDPGSFYAIGAKEGGHEAVHPALGTLDDFARLVAAAQKLDMEVALDFAIQCAPDHPWVREHPEWFRFRPDGSIRYAENPPKKYQDIVNVNFYGPHREALWNALRDIVLLWCARDVRIFRVDNPHTKPLPFWEWLIREVQARYPDAIFLSEAFTRPKMMKALAKLGFTQSYTYFTWRNFKQELTDYLTELTRTEAREYFRPSFFPSTPDILPQFLQRGGPPAFKIRLVLAATLSPVYGIYNGFELCENRGLPGTEEYADSEKYQLKVWDWDRPGHIKQLIGRINWIRGENPALQGHGNLGFWRADDDNVLFYGKATEDRGNLVFVAVNLDPFEPHETVLWFPIAEMGLGDADAFEVEELLTGAKHLWRGSPQRVRLEPESNPAAIWRVRIWKHVEYRAPTA